MSRPRFPRRPQDAISRAGALNSSALPDVPRRVAALERSHRATVPACSAYRNAAVSHTSTGNWQAVTWDAESFDTDGIFTASSTTFTIKTPGLYIVTASVAFAASATGVRSIRVTKGGAAILIGQYEATATAGAAAGRQVAGMLSLAAADTLTVEAFQNSGGNLAYTVGSAYMHFDVAFVSRAS